MAHIRRTIRLLLPGHMEYIRLQSQVLQRFSSFALLFLFILFSFLCLHSSIILLFFTFHNRLTTRRFHFIPSSLFNCSGSSSRCLSNANRLLYFPSYINALDRRSYVRTRCRTFLSFPLFSTFTVFQYSAKCTIARRICLIERHMEMVLYLCGISCV